VARIRLLIVDDQPLMRAGFRAVLEANGFEVVGEAGDGAEAVAAARATRPDVVLMDIQMAAARATRPDVVLMDIQMPNLDGIEAIKQLPNHRVLVLTTFGLDEYIVDALRAGASGFITKDVPAEELVHAVRVVAGGDALLTPAVTRQLLNRVGRRLPAPIGHQPEALSELTEREREVLELLARGMSNAEIADALVVGEATVKTHVSNVLMKLGLRDRVQAVVLAYEIGLVQPGHP
jgi:DNA-binding NarL/FixJ family response regulator